MVVSHKDRAKAFERGRDRKNVRLDPVSGEVIKLLPTLGGNFISKLHYNLHFLKIKDARVITYILALGTSFVMISGLIVHKEFFRKFFTLRSRNFIFDTHLLLGLSSFVIIALLCLSGAYLNQRFILTEFYKDELNKNQEKLQENFKKQAKKRVEKRRVLRASGKFLADKNISFYQPNFTQISDIVTKNKDSLEMIMITKNSPNTAFIQLNFSSNSPFSKNGRSFKAKAYDLKTAKLVDSKDEVVLNASSKFQFLVKNFHIGGFSNWVVDTMFFIFGIFGCLICVSGGAIVYKKSKNLKLKFVIKTLNLTIFIGLITAFGVYLLTNQILPVDMSKRWIVERNAFFITILVVFVISAIFYKKFPLKILSFLASLIFLFVVVAGTINGAFYNPNSFLVLAFCLILATCFLLLSLKFKEQNLKIISKDRS